MEEIIKKKGKGRQKIAMAKIENQDSLYSTFTKRKYSIFKNAGDLSNECDSDVGIIIKSPTSKPHVFVSPSFDVFSKNFFSRHPEYSMKKPITPEEEHKIRLVENCQREKISKLSKEIEVMENKKRVMAEYSLQLQAKVNSIDDDCWQKPVNEHTSDGVKTMEVWLTNVLVPKLKLRAAFLAHHAHTPAPDVDAPAPVVDAPAPDVYAPALLTPAPAVYAPAPVVDASALLTPAPVVYAPAPNVDAHARAPALLTPAPTLARVVDAPTLAVDALACAIGAPAPVVDAPARAPALLTPDPTLARAVHYPTLAVYALACAVDAHAPVVDAPAVDALACAVDAHAPVVDAPAVDAPVVDALARAPVLLTPAPALVRAIDAQAPVVDAPAVDALVRAPVLLTSALARAVDAPTPAVDAFARAPVLFTPAPALARAFDVHALARAIDAHAHARAIDALAPAVDAPAHVVDAPLYVLGPADVPSLYDIILPFPNFLANDQGFYNPNP